MPRNVKGKKVERYKISPEMRSILKQYKRIKRIEGMLKYETAQKQKEFTNLREMWDALREQTSVLETSMPREPLNELEGMDFPKVSEEQMQLRY